MKNIHYRAYFFSTSITNTSSLITSYSAHMTRSLGLLNWVHWCINTVHSLHINWTIDITFNYLTNIFNAFNDSHYLISKLLIITFARDLFLHLHCLMMHWMLVWLHSALGNWAIFITIIFYPHWEKMDQWRVTALRRKMTHLTSKQITQFLQEGYSTMWPCHIISLS